MDSWFFLLSRLLLLVFSATVASAISRQDFPPGFIFGAGSSAYQMWVCSGRGEMQAEGAAAEDGRTPSIWDTFSHDGKTADKNDGDTAADQYHKYKEDVKLMHEMGLDAYRFSISWSRFIPDGRGPVNPKGLQYYNNLIDELLSFGIQPHVTLCHFDLPQTLEDEYAGLLSPKIVDDFTAYADVCFKEFGDRVKYWITFNEPNVDAILGHDVGLFPPRRCSSPFGRDCSQGNSTTEPYISAHNMLLSHASAVKLYRQKYQSQQGGYIGITLLAMWFEPSTNSLLDVAATQRMTDFHIGWFMDPLIFGTYPAIMKDIVDTRLPFLGGQTSEDVKGSFDFIGLNHYGMIYIQNYVNHWKSNQRDYVRDLSVRSPDANGLFGKVFIGLKMKLPPLPISTLSLQRLLEYVKERYRDPPIFIHENGFGEYGNNITNIVVHDDVNRLYYLESYIKTLLLSTRNGSNTRGYFVWSFMDCFELVYGYTGRYGLYGVDFNDKDRKRYPRLSAEWYTNFLIRNSTGKESQSLLLSSSSR